MSQTIFLVMILVPHCFIEYLWIVEQWVFNDGGTSQFSTHHPCTHTLEPSIFEKSKQMSHP
jgi:hypothetical protein